MMLPEVIQPEVMEPIFVIGRQHSGNTMLATLLGRVPSVLGLTSEGGFFEARRELDGLAPEERAERTARRIRDNGVRAYLRTSSVEQDMSIWEVITPSMKEMASYGATATELYAFGMQQVLERVGKKRWVQKATSYIFLTDDILKAFPRARLIFIARNPLDLAASTRKRNQSHRDTLRLALGWNRGMKYALRLQEEQPQNFFLLRYEDLVRDPDQSVRDVCAFCGLPFDPEYLDIPHVNRSEAPYKLSSEKRGLSTSRVFYYRSVLSPVEETAIRLAVNRAILRRLYPEVPTSSAEEVMRTRLCAVSLLTSSAAVLLAEQGRALAKTPSRTLERIARRFRA